MSTRRYLITKILQALLTLVFVLAVNFFLFRGLGNPATQLLRGHTGISQQAVHKLEAQLGLGLPLPQQFLHYVKETLQGNFGYSYFYNQPVKDVIGGKIWPTVLLIGSSTIVTIFLGVLIGIYQGWKRASKFDVGMLGFTLVTYSMPEFWFGLILIMLLCSGTFFGLTLFPTGGYSTAGADLTGFAHWIDVINHMVLPFFVLVVAYLGEYSLIMRSSMLDTLGEDYITTARSKGMLEDRVLRKHAVPNALLPTMTVTILSLGFIISGAITIELIFSWPGLGLLTATAVTNGPDFPVLQALFLLFSASVIVANLIADLSYSYLDPRVRAA